MREGQWYWWRDSQNRRRKDYNNGESGRRFEEANLPALVEATRHAKYVTFQLAAVAVPHRLFAAIHDRSLIHI